MVETSWVSKTLPSRPAQASTVTSSAPDRPTTSWTRTISRPDRCRNRPRTISPLRFSSANSLSIPSRPSHDSTIQEALADAHGVKRSLVLAAYRSCLLCAFAKIGIHSRTLAQIKRQNCINVRQMQRRVSVGNFLSGRAFCEGSNHRVQRYTCPTHAYCAIFVNCQWRSSLFDFQYHSTLPSLVFRLVVTLLGFTPIPPTPPTNGATLHPSPDTPRPGCAPCLRRRPGWQLRAGC